MTKFELQQYKEQKYQEYKQKNTEYTLQRILNEYTNKYDLLQTNLEEGIIFLKEERQKEYNKAIQTNDLARLSYLELKGELLSNVSLVSQYLNKNKDIIKALLLIKEIKIYINTNNPRVFDTIQELEKNVKNMDLKNKDTCITCTNKLHFRNVNLEFIYESMINIEDNIFKIYKKNTFKNIIDSIFRHYKIKEIRKLKADTKEAI